MKKKFVSLAQLALGFGILAVILYRLHHGGDLGKLALAVREAAGNWPHLLGGALGFGFCILMCVFRWRTILQAQDVHLPFRRLYTLYLVGQFFSAFMLGATGGDVVKAYYISTETHHKRTEVIATIVIDRVIGLLALILLTVLVMLARLPFFLATAQMRLALGFNSALLVGTILALAVVFRQNLFERWAFFRRLEERTALGRILRRAYTAFHMCLRHRGLLTRTMLLSLANHVAFVIAAYELAKALRLDLAFSDMLTVFPLINAVAAIPLTPGGLGTREGAAIYLLGVLNVPEARAVTLSLFVYATIMLWSIIGGLVYLGYTYRRGARAPAPADSEPSCAPRDDTDRC
jgi:uncharacterized protein (TIRG00374 family)